MPDTKFTEGGDAGGIQPSLFDRHSDGGIPLSLANLSPRQESAKGLTMSVISGRKCFELFARSTRYTSSLKTFADCLRSNLERFTPRSKHSWKAWVTKSQHFVFQLQPSARGTAGTGFGLWDENDSDDGILGVPTPRTRGLLGGSGSKQMMQAQVNANAISDEDAIGLMGVRMLPTPQARDFKHPDQPHQANFQRKVEKGYTIDLNSTIAMLPTPTTSDAEGGLITDGEMNETGFSRQNAAGVRWGIKLKDAIETVSRMLPTPTAGKTTRSGQLVNADGRPWDGTSKPHSATTGRPVTTAITDTLDHIRESSTGLRYQPAFGEWMMGYPLNWTSLETDELIPIGFDVPWVEMAMATCQMDGEANPQLGTRDNRAARIKAIGNSIVSEVALEIFRAIEETERRMESE